MANWLMISILCSIVSCQNIQPNISTTCVHLRDEFAVALSNFNLCSVTYSRPITFCENCINPFITLLGAYTNMSMVESGVRCIDNFVNLDRLQIVETLYSDSINLWNRAKCYECYLLENGTQTNKTTEETSEFQTYYNNFMSCFNQTQTQKEKLCADCMNKYEVLSTYYSSISNSNEKIGVCMDLVDMMNNTWTLWSTNCCQYRRHNEYIFITSTVIVLVLPVLFYIVVQFYGERKVPTIIQQTRLAESISNMRN